MTYGGVPRYDWPSIDRLRMDASAGDVARDGNGDLVGESAGRDGTYARPPSSPDYGITTYELSQYVRDFARWCAQRVEGVGMAEYDRVTHQKFEEMSIQQLVQGLQEELADAQNYIAMISLLIGRLAKSLPKESDERETDMGNSGSPNSVSP